MRHYSLFTKCISWLVLSSMLLGLLPQSLFAADGPSSPEAAQFEPVEGTDLVNLYTGDFAYNLPLIDIPGPEGNWPVNMSYHAGIGPNKEATWVGLGWSLNPGSINRFSNGYPDDYWSADVVSVYDIPKKKSRGTRLNLALGPFSANYSYDSFKSKTGFNAGISIIGAMKTVAAIATGNPGLLAPPPIDINIMAGTSGVGMSVELSYKALDVSIGTEGVGAGVGIPGTYDNRIKDERSKIGISSSGRISFSMIGIDFFSTGKGGMSFFGANPGAHTQTDPGPIQSRVKVHDYSWLKALTFGTISLSKYEAEWWLSTTGNETGYGTLHYVGQSAAVANHPMNNWGPQSGNKIFTLSSFLEDDVKLLLDDNSNAALLMPNDYYDRQVERSAFDNQDQKILASSEDLYQVSAQGISGTFKPYLDYSFKLYDIGGAYGNGWYDSYSQNYQNTANHIQFRFLGDPGSNFVTLQAGHGTSYSPLNVGAQKGSRTINPVIDPETGVLIGFEIVAEDGKIYEFLRPVLSHFEYSYNKNKTNGAVSYTELSKPYATSWLLTGIKGPDYVDKGDPGYSADDWGFWIKFRYEEASNTAMSWRSPFSGVSVDPTQVNQEYYSQGIKQQVYLKSIETATHLLQFHVQRRDDDSCAFVSLIKLGVVKIEDLNQTGLKRAVYPIRNDQLQSLFVNSTDTLIVTRKVSNGLSFYQLGNNGQNLQPYNGIYSAITFQDPGYGNPGNVELATLQIRPNSNFKFQNYAKQLAKITLHKKVLKLGSDKADYDLTYNQTVLEAINFEYDYSLIPGSPNSLASGQGKLTLRSISKSGLNNEFLLPSTEFDYSNNPSYDKDKWDYWNGYSSVGTLALHTSSSNHQIANNDAGAWNLTSILTPLGSEINVVYESDRIAHVGQGDIMYYMPYTNVSSTINHAPGTTLNLVLGDDAGGVVEAFNKGYKDFVLITNWNSTMWFDGNDYGEPTCSCCDPYSTNGSTYEKVKVISASGNQITLSSPVTFFADHQHECGTDNEDRTYTYSIGVEGILSGGHRVRAISVADGIDKKETVYIYKSGVTPVLPSGYETQMSVSESYRPIVNNGFNLLGPPPIVGYEGVEVYEVDPYEQGFKTVLNGKTVFKYFTAKDYPFSVSISGNSITLVDRSVIYGQQSKILTYGIKDNTTGQNDDDFFLTDKIEFDYKFSRDLSSFAKCYKNNFTSIDPNTEPLGMLQTKYYSQNVYDPTKYFESIFDNAYLITTTSTTYLFNLNNNYLECDSVKMCINNLAFDVYSGSTLISQSNSSKNEQVINEMVPAYWKFPGLSEKNMLTQQASNKRYLAPAGTSLWRSVFLQNHYSTTITSKVSQSFEYSGTFANGGDFVFKVGTTPGGSDVINILDTLGVIEGEFHGFFAANGGQTYFISLESAAASATVIYYDLNDYLQSASSTTWKDWGSGQWRQNDQYVATKTGADYVEFTAWNPPADEYNNPQQWDILNGWKRTSNITDFDRYGHPTEERGMNGVYTASLYGYGDALPVAIATNARKEELCFYHFESGVSKSDARSGERAGFYFNNVAIIDSSIGNVIVAAPSSVPEGGQYFVSYWLKPLVQTEWKYYEGILNPGQQLLVSGNGMIDDIRIHPVNSTMSTFTYDPLTWKVTAITDANNISTFYEYDGAGRLIKVYDQDHNMIKKHIYQYKRTN